MIRRRRTTYAAPTPAPIPTQAPAALPQGCNRPQMDALLACARKKDSSSASCIAAKGACAADKTWSQLFAEKQKVNVGGLLGIPIEVSFATSTGATKLGLVEERAAQAAQAQAFSATLTGTCGAAGKMCMTDMFGIRGVGLSTLSASGTSALDTMTIESFAKVDISGSFLIGTAQQPFAGTLSGAALAEVAFAMNNIPASTFTEFLRRAGTSLGLDWMKNLPNAAAGVTCSLSFTNTATADVDAGIGLSCGGFKLPSDLVARLGSVEFLQGMTGTLAGTIAAGFVGAKIADSKITFGVTNSASLGPATLTGANIAFTGGAATPTLSGDMTLGMTLPQPATGSISLNKIAFTYTSATKTLALDGSVSVTFASAFPSGTVAFSMAKSPAEQSFTLSPASMSQFIPGVALSGAKLECKRTKTGSKWSPAVWSVALTAKPNFGGFPQLTTTATFDRKCVSATIGADDAFKVWGVGFSETSVFVKHCSRAQSGKKKGTEVGFTGTVGINGATLKTFTLGAIDAFVSPAPSWRPALSNALGMTLAKMPTVYFTIALSHGAGATNPGLTVSIPIDKNKEIVQAILPFPIEVGAGAALMVVIPFAKPIKPVVKIVLPGLAMKMGKSVTWKPLSIEVGGIASGKPQVTLAWGLFAQLPDKDGKCCTAAANPKIDFSMSISAVLPTTGPPTFVLRASMIANGYLEDFLGIPNLGVKGLALMIGLTPNTPFIRSFGLGATLALYMGKVGVKDTNSAGALGSKIVLGATIAGQVDIMDATNQCIYFSLVSTKMSKVLTYVAGKTVSVPSVLNVVVTKAEFGLSTKLNADRCMSLSPVLQTGIMWDVSASWLGFSVQYAMKFFKKASSPLPHFSFKLSITNSGATTKLKGAIKSKVAGARAKFVSLCAPYPIVKDICAAAAWLVTKLLNALLAVLFDVFQFYHLKVDVPDLQGIANGGDWPSFAIKFKLLGFTIDISLNLGKLAGALQAILLKGLNAAASFVSKLWSGIKAWFSELGSNISLTVKSCRQLLCGCEQSYYKKDHGLCNSCGRKVCPAHLCGCKQYYLKKDWGMCNTCGRTRRRLGEGAAGRLGEGRASDHSFAAAMEAGSSSGAGKFLEEQPSAAAATVAVAGAWRAVPQRALGELPEDATRPVAPASEEEEIASVAPASEGSAGDELLEGMHERVGAAPSPREALATDEAMLGGMLERRLSKSNADSWALAARRLEEEAGQWSEAAQWSWRRRFSDNRRRFGDSRRRWFPPPRPCKSCRSHWWGCQAYKSCADPICGCKSCRSHWWGCEKYISCKDLFCGFDFVISRRRRRGR